MESSHTGGGEAAGARRRRVSPWVWAGCGCGALVLLAALVAGGFVWVGVRQVRDVERLERDPAALAQRIQTIVPYRDLPAGYEPDLVIALPVFNQTAIFARREAGRPAPAPDSAPRFMYSRTFALGGGVATEAQRQRFLDPKRGMPSWLGGLSVRLPHIETLRTGSFEVGGHRVYYRVQRALIESHGEKKSIFTTVGMIDCRDPMHSHSVVWTGGRLGAPGAQGEQADRGDQAEPRAPAPQAASAAERGDPAAMAEFLGHFNLCGGG